jgi:hypothetical protein
MNHIFTIPLPDKCIVKRHLGWSALKVKVSNLWMNSLIHLFIQYLLGAYYIPISLDKICLG